MPAAALPQADIERRLHICTVAHALARSPDEKLLRYRDQKRKRTDSTGSTYQPQRAETKESRTWHARQKSRETSAALLTPQNPKLKPVEPVEPVEQSTDKATIEQ